MWLRAERDLASTLAMVRARRRREGGGREERIARIARPEMKRQNGGDVDCG